jgi:two-component sensor histidine kinase
LYYRDNGTGYPQGTIVDRAGGLGNYLLRGMSRQLKGSLRTFNDGGAVAVVTFRRKEGFSAILSQPEGEKETSTP